MACASGRARTKKEARNPPASPSKLHCRPANLAMGWARSDQVPMMSLQLHTTSQWIQTVGLGLLGALGRHPIFVGAGMLEWLDGSQDFVSRTQDVGWAPIPDVLVVPPAGVEAA